MVPRPTTTHTRVHIGNYIKMSIAKQGHTVLSVRIFMSHLMQEVSRTDQHLGGGGGGHDPGRGTHSNFEIQTLMKERDTGMVVETSEGSKPQNTITGQWKCPPILAKNDGRTKNINCFFHPNFNPTNQRGIPFKTKGNNISTAIFRGAL